MLGSGHGRVLLSVAAFSGATPARAQAGRHQYVQFGARIRRHAVRQGARMRSTTGPERQSSFRRAPICRRQKTAVRDPAWPNDPDVIEERRAAMDSRRPAPQIDAKFAGRNVADGTAAGQGPVAVRGPPDECQAGSGTPICLYTPWKALKSVVTGFQPDTVQPGPEPPRKYLTEPPPGYRQANRGRQGNHRNAERPAGLRRSGRLHPVAASQNLGR